MRILINTRRRIIMPIYTKATITTSESSVYTPPAEWLTLVMDKARQMVSEGKTDGNYQILDEFRVRRVWLDQSAADEWVSQVSIWNAQYNVVITDIQIVDNPSGVL